MGSTVGPAVTSTVRPASAPAGMVAAPSATAAGSGVSGAAAVGRSFDSEPSALCSG